MNNLSDYLDAPTHAEYRTPGFLFLEATVAENAHKDFPGMIKVEYAAFAAGKNTSAWLPLLHPYAGKEHGCFLKPEIGDLVLVGFLGHDMERPFVLGSLYPANAGVPSDHYDENNLSRHFKTKGGVEMTIYDQKEKQAVEVTTPKGLHLRLDDDKGSIILSDKDGKNTLTVDSQGNSLALQGDSGLTLKAGKCEITLDANSGKIEIKCAQFEVKADQSAAVSANSTLSLEGAVAKIEGKQTASLKGNTLAEVSGGILKLN